MQHLRLYPRCVQKFCLRLDVWGFALAASIVATHVCHSLCCSRPEEACTTVAVQHGRQLLQRGFSLHGRYFCSAAAALLQHHSGGWDGCQVLGMSLLASFAFVAICCLLLCCICCVAAALGLARAWLKLRQPYSVLAFKQCQGSFAAVLFCFV